VVVREAVRDRSAAAHEQSLFDLKAHGTNPELPHVEEPLDQVASTVKIRAEAD
jgi:hypothetical protein